MRLPGDFVGTSDHAVGFRRMEPAPARPRRLLLLLHGWGSDEAQLQQIGTAVDTDTLVVLPRGPRSTDEETYGWYRVSFSDGDPQAVREEMEESLARLLEFVGQLQSQHAVAAGRTVVAGFSQGGALASAIALTHPSCVAGFAMLGGRILPEIASRIAPLHALASLHALIVHGRDDDTLPIRWFEDATAALRRFGITCETHLEGAGHEPVRRMQARVASWFVDERRPWQR